MASPDGRVCKDFVAISNLPQMRRLRPRQRIWLIHDHASYKRQDGGQSPGLLTYGVLSTPTQPPLEEKAEMGRGKASMKSTASPPSQAPPRWHKQRCLRGQGDGSNCPQQAEKGWMGKGFEIPVQDAKREWLDFILKDAKGEFWAPPARRWPTSVFALVRPTACWSHVCLLH